MSSPIFESVPNFSEGRRIDVVKAIEYAGGKHASVLDVHTDVDHNRGVLTIAGEAESLLAAMMEATLVAVASIDLRQHEGVHPRLGAMDVIPIVPLEGASMNDAVELATGCARRIAEELGIPTFLYGEGSPNRTELPQIRREAFNNLKPSFGPHNPHISAGAAVVGARSLLVAFNVNLVANMQVAGQIARSIRESDGGLEFVRALAFPLPSRGLTQISMNLVNPTVTRIPDAYDAVGKAAEELGAQIVEAELVGLAPRESFGRRDPESVGLNSLPKILEDELARISKN